MAKENQGISFTFSDMKRAEISEAAKDEAMGQWLWKVSEKWSGLSDATW